MELRKAISFFIAVMFLSVVVVPAVAGLIAFRLPPANQTQHDVEASTQRNQTPGGAGLPGGANPFFPTTFPLPSPSAKP